MTDYHVLDAPRPFGNTELGRVILDCPGDIYPHIEEMDTYVVLPVRLIYDQAAALQVEIGPYSLDGKDIETLRAAIAAYDQAMRQS